MALITNEQSIEYLVFEQRIANGYSTNGGEESLKGANMRVLHMRSNVERSARCLLDVSREKLIITWWLHILCTSKCVFVRCVNNFAILLILNIPHICKNSFICYVTCRLRQNEAVFLAAHISNGYTRPAKGSTSSVPHYRVCVCAWQV